MTTYWIWFTELCLQIFCFYTAVFAECCSQSAVYRVSSTKLRLQSFVYRNVFIELFCHVLSLQTFFDRASLIELCSQRFVYTAVFTELCSQRFLYGALFTELCHVIASITSLFLAFTPLRSLLEYSCVVFRCTKCIVHLLFILLFITVT